jgi:hypothetical protein
MRRPPHGARRFFGVGMRWRKRRLQLDAERLGKARALAIQRCERGLIGDPTPARHFPPDRIVIAQIEPEQQRTQG